MFEQKFRHNKRGMIRIVLLLCLVGVGTTPLPVLAAKNPPTTITSQTMIANNKEGTVIFQGKVHLNQADLDVQSDEMIVRFTTEESIQTTEAQSSDEGGKRKISVIEAKGHVVILKGEGKATCGHAIYYKAEERIVLTEDPVAWQAGTRVSGPKMTMYLKEDRSVVEGGTSVLIEEQEGI
jgi:lipopolysaccharide export system protein LptA